MRYDVEVSGFPSSHAGHLVLLRLKDQNYPGAKELEDWPTWDLPILQWATKLRTGPAQWLAEVVATAGLLLVILRAPPARVAPMVAAYIGAAYWFTASTSFANPAAAFGRMFSDSFAGIAPQNVPSFVVAQLLGAAVGAGIHEALGARETS